MVRIFVYTLVAAALLGGLVAGVACWVLYTEDGTDFAVRQLLRRTDTRITSGTIEGTFAHGLQAERLLLEGQDLSLELGELNVAIALNSFYPLRLTLEPVHLRRLHIRLPEAPATEATSSTSAIAINLPELNPFFDHIDLRIADVSVQDLRIDRNAENLLEIKQLNATVQFSKRRLSIDLHLLENADLTLTGALTLDTTQPAAAVSATATATDATSPWQRLDLDSSLSATAETLHGAVTARLRLLETEPIELATDLAFRENRLGFDALMIRQQGRDGAVAASGSLDFGEPAPVLNAVLRFQALDIEAEAGMPLTLSGRLQVVYAEEQYRGDFNLESRGSELTSATVRGSFIGNHQQVSLQNLHGDWLAAQINGGLKVGWEPDLDVHTQVTVLGLTTDPFYPQLESVINARLSATYSAVAREQQATLDLDLFDSVFHGQPLAGTAQLRYQDDDLLIDSLNLHGDRAGLWAHGALSEKIDYRLRVEEMAALYPHLGGEMTAHGWLRRLDDAVTGELTLQGKTLRYDQWTLGALQAEFALNAGDFFTTLTVIGTDLTSAAGPAPIEQLYLTGSGTPERHQADVRISSRHGAVTAAVHGGWSDPAWHGTLTRLDLDLAELGSWHLRDTIDLTVSPELIKATTLTLADNSGRILRLEEGYYRDQDDFRIALAWDRLSLSLLDPWLPDIPVSGSSSGNIALSQAQDEKTISAEIRVAGDLRHPRIQLRDIRSELRLNWDAQGLDASVTLQLENDTAFSSRFLSTDPASFELPQAIDVQLRCQDLPLSLVRPWLPQGITLDGQLACESSGRWSSDSFSITGQVSLAGGKALWHDSEQLIDVAVQTAELHWQWQQDFRAELTLIYDFGQLNADLVLPIEVRWPLVVAESLPLQASLDLSFHENGLLSVFFPQQIQDSRGQIDLTAVATGTMTRPQLSGKIQLQNSELYLPGAGIRISDIGLSGVMTEQLLTMEQLQFTSGTGTITGQGSLALRDWLPERFELSLSGQEFQLLSLPSLMVQVSPDLRLQGNMEQIEVRGDVRIPYVMVKDQKGRAVVRNSPDLVILDRDVAPEKERRFRHDIDIQLILGDQVLVDAAGLEARIAGTMRLYSDIKQDFAAQGRLQVARGRFSSYGITLDVERGDLFYSGGPLNQPTLDILAIRRAGEVRAGIRATGTPQEPVVQLYSEPAMQDADILGYIVLGRPLGATGEDTDLLLAAAGALLSQGESIMLQEKLKSRLGLDVLEFSAGEGDVYESVITTGKYLTPDLYVSLGYSLFTNTNEMKIRYRLTRALDLESSFGIESGVDLFYRFEIE